jgi:hypothetical protein
MVLRLRHVLAAARDNRSDHIWPQRLRPLALAALVIIHWIGQGWTGAAGTGIYVRL